MENWSPWTVAGATDHPWFPLGVSSSEYQPLKLGARIESGQTGSLILSNGIETDFTYSQNLGTGIGTRAGSVPIPGYPLQPLAFFFKKNLE